MKRLQKRASLRSREVVTWFRRSCWLWHFDRRYGLTLRALARRVPVGEASSDHLQPVGISPMRKIDASRLKAGEQVVSAALGSWKALYPQLAEYLTTVVWEDGSVRVPSVLRILVRGNVWVGEVQDANYQRVLRFEVFKPEDLLPGLESLVDDPEAPWQPAPWLTPPKAGRRKK